MKICAVICEYNPFHTGHLYQLSEAKKSFDEIICIMSGNFVQRAEPAIAEKNVRARIALNCGTSMVLELPLLYAIANGERFAEGAVKTLSRLENIDALVMGCEAENTKALLALAEIQSEENEEFKTQLSRLLNDGNSYAAAITEATVSVAEKNGIEKAEAKAILSAPNNLLCIEYVKAAKKYGFKAKPFFIKRKGNSYNNISASGSYLSATALRELIKNENFTAAMPYLTGEYDTLLKEIKLHRPDFSLYEKIAVCCLRCSTLETIAKTFDCREGVEYKLLENALKYVSLSEILRATKSKRYTMSRLKRIVLQLLLGVTKDLMNNNEYLPPRLLAVKENFKPYLAANGNKFIIRNDDFRLYDSPFYEKYFDAEKRAAAIYSVVTSNDSNLFVPQKLYSI